MTDTETRTPSAVYRAFARFLRFVYGKWWKAKHQLLSPRAIRSIDSTAEWAIALTVVAKASLEAAAASWGGIRYVLYGTWAAVALLGVSRAAQVTLGRRRQILEDVEQIRHTQDKLDHFRDEAASVESKAALKRLTLAYVQGLLGSVCKALGRPGETRASIMLEEKDALVLRYIYPLPPRLDTDWAFSLPVRDRRASGRAVLQDEAIGAAGYAYWGLDTVCVPRISLRTGYWVVRKEDGQLEQSKIHYPVWVKSNAAKRYSCLVSVPVYVALSEERYSRWGVFNIEDKKADAMSDTDCYVACIFASLLAQGYNISQENYSRLEVEHKTAAPA